MRWHTLAIAAWLPGIIAIQPPVLLAQTDDQGLSLGVSIERGLSRGEVHRYGVDLKSDQFVLVTVDQQGIDVLVRILGPGGEELVTVDSPNGRWGLEPVQLISSASGRHVIEVEPLQGDGEAIGKYVIVLQRLEPTAKAHSGRVDQLFAAWDLPGSPGASVAIARNGEIIYQNGYGYAQLEYDVPATDSTIFHVASVSKQFTAFAVAMLAEQGKLSLADDIREHLPYVPDFGDIITVRHLIHHTSGLRDQWNLLALAGWRLDDVITKDQIIRLVSRQRELNFPPGTEYLYCNTGYTLLADIVERVSGQPFVDWTAANLFRPLGMVNTHFHDDHEMVVPNRAYSYAPGGRRGWRKSVLSYANVGATSLFTTAADLTKWMHNLDEGTLGGPAVTRLMHTRGTTNNGDTLSYAFGLVIGSYRGLRTVGHGGADAGFRSNVIRFPDQGYAIAVLSNAANLNAGRMAQEVAGIYLEDLLEPMVQETEAESVVGGDTVVVDPSLFDEYVGDYQLEVGISISVTKDGDRLMIQAAGQPAAELRAESDSTFYVAEASARVTFHRDAAGRASQITVEQGGQVLTGERGAPVELTAEMLAEYAGTYYSEELGTRYTIEVEGADLVARHIRHDPIALTRRSRDVFAGGMWFLGQARFERNEAGTITGMRVSSGRVRNLLFRKIGQ
jgi:CubicO group peptidase (beta-lactamase class C family)